MVGLVFGIYPLVIFIFAPVCGFMVSDFLLYFHIFNCKCLALGDNTRQALDYVGNCNYNKILDWPYLY